MPGLIRFHDLRHTSATLLFAAGVHPKVVQERLGHSQAGITLDTYSHVVPTMQREAADKLDEMMRPSFKVGTSMNRVLRLERNHALERDRSDGINLSDQGARRVALLRVEPCVSYVVFVEFPGL